MKVLHISYTLFFIFTSILSQKIIWLDQDLKPTAASKASYYKVGDKKDGQITFFYKNRTVYRKVFMTKGELEGKFQEFYKTGELREIGMYEDGLREGNWKEFYKSGKIKKRGKYQNGEKVGIWKVFYKNVY